MRRTLPVLASLALAAVVAVVPAAAVTGGVPDGDGHPFVGSMYGETADGHQTTGCSGVLIAPTVFITSGGCTEMFKAASIVDKVWVTFDPNAPIAPFDPPTYPPSVLVTELITNPAFLAAGGTYDQSAPGNVGVAILDVAQPGPYADLSVAGRLDALTGSEIFTAVAYGMERNSSYNTFERRYSSADFRGIGPDELFLHLTESDGGATACIGQENEAGGGFIGASEVAALIIKESNGCVPNATLQRLDVSNVRDFLDDYLILP